MNMYEKSNTNNQHRFPSWLTSAYGHIDTVYTNLSYRTLENCQWTLVIGGKSAAVYQIENEGTTERKPDRVPNHTSATYIELPKSSTQEKWCQYFTTYTPNMGQTWGQNLVADFLTREVI